MHGLGLDGSICRPKIRLRDIKGLKLFFFVVENQAALLTLGEDS